MKKYSKYYLITILSLLLLAQCQSNESELTSSHSTIYIDLNNEPTDSLFNLSQDIQVIPLEETVQSVLGRMAHQVCYYQDNILLLDKANFTVKVFDQQGNFIKSIENKGKGPGEYFMLYDMAINPYNEKLELLSPDGKVFSYDLESGTAETEIILADVSSVAYFEHLSPDLTVFYSEFEPERLIYYSRAKKTIVRRDFPNLDEDRKIRMSMMFSPFHEYEGKLQFLDPQSNTVYTLTPSGPTFKFALDFGDHQFDIKQIPDKVTASVNGFKEYVMKHEIAFPIYGYYEDRDRIWVTTVLGKECRSVIYNKADQSSQSIYVPLEHFMIPTLKFEGNNITACLLKPELAEAAFAGSANQKLSLDTRGTNPVVVKYQLK